MRQPPDVTRVVTMAEERLLACLRFFISHLPPSSLFLSFLRTLNTGVFITGIAGQGRAARKEGQASPRAHPTASPAASSPGTAAGLISQTNRPDKQCAHPGAATEHNPAGGPRSPVLLTHCPRHFQPQSWLLTVTPGVTWESSQLATSSPALQVLGLHHGQWPRADSDHVTHQMRSLQKH